MKLSTTNSWLFLVSLIGSALGGVTYSLSNSIVGKDFYSSFTFKAISDPTNSHVNYVDEATAQSLNLTYATSSTFIMHADDTTVLSSSGLGRNSVRIHSNNQYTTHVAVFNMPHMPQGCGMWPAVWETDESNWPNGGEVNIVEGVNNIEPNQSTLDTSADCSIPTSGVTQLGTTVGMDCNAEVNGNAGCGVQLSKDDNSFGPGFNSIDGGWYALWFCESTNNFNSKTLQGIPATYFPNTECDLETHFDANNIIINLTFCGDWAGNSAVYAASGCPSDCVDYVNGNPTAFTDAYFQFMSINIYE